ncbi:MAG: ATP-binding protein [Rikenellaceae bacterium]
MATDFTNKIRRQSRLFTFVLILLWGLVIPFIGFRVILSTGIGDNIAWLSSDELVLYDNIFIFIALIVTLLTSFIWLMFRRLCRSLNESAERIEREQLSALREEQEKIRIKRHLTNNINHELKTPICSIIGYLDLILTNENLDIQNTRNFVKKSFDQAERLRQLMLDLSTITRIDEGGDQIGCESVNITQIVESIVDDTLPQAHNNNIVVENRISQNISINGNHSLVYSIFRNLVDNAISYSGGRHVFIELMRSNPTEFSFRVRDNGIGIDAVHLPYLFERFYRVDTGRSRKLGGTGLGLSIVKNAVLFHGGSIIAQLTNQGSLEFIFTLKVNS